MGILGFLPVDDLAPDLDLKPPRNEGLKGIVETVGKHVTGCVLRVKGD
jgi:hypothetical protein